MPARSGPGLARRDAPAPPTPAGLMLSLQGRVGNAAVARLVAGGAGARALIQRDEEPGPGDVQAERGSGAQVDTGWYKGKLDVGEAVVLTPSVPGVPKGAKATWSVGQADGSFIDLVDIVDKPDGKGEIRLRGKAVGKESIWLTAYVGPDDERGRRVGPLTFEVFPAGSNHGRKAAPAGGPDKDDGTDAQNANRKKWMGAGRSAMQTEIVGLINSIEKLKTDRIKTWTDIASQEDAKPLKAALTVAVTIVGYGLGGVVGGWLTHGMAHGLAQEFVKEVAHKGSDKAIVAGWSALVADTRSTLDTGTRTALANAGGLSEQSLLNKTKLLEAYAEAMRLFVIDEEREQVKQFNLSGAGYDDLRLADRIAALSEVYSKLRDNPAPYARELSEGLIRLKDEAFLNKQAEDHGGDRAKTEREDEDVHDVAPRSGNLLLQPVGGGAQFSLGPWGSPRLSFSGFRGRGTGDTNSKTLNALAGTKVKDLPFSIGFRFWADDPFYRLVKGGSPVKVMFGRQPSGLVWVDNDVGEGAEEWLASYHLQDPEILSDKVRKANAPLGAQKLYDQIKDMVLEGAENFDLI